MLRESSFLVRIKIVADVLLLGTIIILTTVTRTENAFFTPTTIVFLSINLLCWVFTARAFGLYSDLRMKPISMEWVMFLKAFGIYSLLKPFIYYQILEDFTFERYHFLVNSVLVFTLLPAQKLIIRIIFKKIRNSQNYCRKVLIVGAGKTGMNFYENCVLNHQYGYQLTGFLDDEKQPGLNGSYLGTTSDIEEVIANYELDDIVVALPVTREQQIEKIVLVGEREGKRVRIVPDYNKFGIGKMHVDSLGNLSIITLRSLPLDYLDNKIYKRVFDIVFSLLGIVFLFSWLCPIISIIIKLTSKGPVFFKQARWGLNNATISCLKFRTMVADSKDVDDEGNYLQAQKNDPRITRIGKFFAQN